jgi:5-methylcytosine-specific restriction protein A
VIREVLSLISESYERATKEPLRDNPVAEFIRGEAPNAIRTTIANDYYLVEGSPGQGNWADVPWIAVFDPTVTTSATRGYYVVYLFTTNMKAVYLCLGQGTTSVREEFGTQTHDELKRLASLMRARLSTVSGTFSSESIKLGGSTRLATDYEPAVALSKRYDFESLPPEDNLKADLLEMVSLYVMLTARGGRENFEDLNGTDAAEIEGSTIEERRRYRQHRKIERASKAAKLAKRAHAYGCQGCGLDFSVIYGPAGKDYIEAHHLTPLSELPEDVPVSLDPKRDFTVLCANCHRMIHRKNGPRTVAELGEFPGVKEMRRLFETLSLELARNLV